MQHFVLECSVTTAACTTSPAAGGVRGVSPRQPPCLPASEEGHSFGALAFHVPACLLPLTLRPRRYVDLPLQESPHSKKASWLSK